MLKGGAMITLYISKNFIPDSNIRDVIRFDSDTGQSNFLVYPLDKILEYAALKRLSVQYTSFAPEFEKCPGAFVPLLLHNNNSAIKNDMKTQRDPSGGYKVLLTKQEWKKIPDECKAEEKGIKSMITSIDGKNVIAKVVLTNTEDAL